MGKPAKDAAKEMAAKVEDVVGPTTAPLATGGDGKYTYYDVPETAGREDAETDTGRTMTDMQNTAVSGQSRSLALGGAATGARGPMHFQNRSLVDRRDSMTHSYYATSHIQRRI